MTQTEKLGYGNYITNIQKQMQFDFCTVSTVKILKTDIPLKQNFS